MKKIITILILFVGLSNVNAQHINWQTLAENQHQLYYVNIGYDFGLTTQIGMAHQINTVKPLFLVGDFSLPMGSNLLDDFKIRIGGQIKVLEKNHFIAAASIRGIFRKHQTSNVNITSFGMETNTTVGYYKSKWHIAAELGLDKFLKTHLTHTEIMRENYQEIKDGWFNKGGGQFYYGIQYGRTLGERLELSLRLGANNAILKGEDALLPVYTQVGLIYRKGIKKR